ncbi:MAG: LysR family transcriptional regulator [Myxococcaceae bacterium]|nr:LysR family transcriptional regulator [Myxococcaceae bacterium]
MADLDWNDLKVLAALARHGSLGSTGRALQLDPSTVGRRLAALEVAASVKVTVRTPDGLSLTPEGRALAAAAESMSGALVEALGQLGGRDADPAGVVRVTATDTSAALVLSGLAGLSARWPALTVEVSSSNAPEDIARREADIAVRFFRPQQDSLVVRKLGDVGWAVYGAERYLERRPLAAGAERLDGHDVVGYTDSVAAAPGPRWLAAHLGTGRVAVRASSPAGALSAVEGGAGLGVLPCFVAEGHVVRARPGIVASSEAFSVVHPDLKAVPRVRVVLDALAELFEREAALLRGDVAPRPRRKTPRR